MRLTLRTWAVVACLVALQAPVMFAVKSGPTRTKKPTIDLEIEQLEQTSSSDTVHVLVQTSGDIKVLAAELRTKGIKVRRQLLESGTFAIDISANDLLWLEGLDGVDSISVDAAVYSAPLSAESLLSYGGGSGTVKKASDLRAQLGLTDSDPTGNGIGVAIVDSGIAPVSDLSSRIAAFYDFTTAARRWRPRRWTATATARMSPDSSPAAGPSSGQFAGVAPDARLIGLRVLTTRATVRRAT